MRKLRALFAALLLIACTSAANVVVQNGAVVYPEPEGGEALSHGDTFTIDGSGFGSAPAVADFLQPTIEATGVGASMAFSSPWELLDANPVDPDWEGYNDATRGRAVRAGYDEGNTIDVGLMWDPGSNIGSNTYQYATWWTRTENLGPNIVAEADDDDGCNWNGVANGWQYKIWRFRFNESVNDSFGSGDMLMPHWDNEDGSNFSAGPGEGGPNDSFHYINCTGCSGGTCPLPPFVNNVSGRRAGGDDLPTLYRSHWFRVEVFFFSGSGATGSVRVKVWHDGSVQEWRHVVNLQDIDWLGGGRAYRYFQIQNYLGNLESDGNFTGTRLGLDDLYVSRMSGSLRHVELCASATYSSCTWREIQDWATWSNTQITGPLNTGAGRTGTLFLHVVEMNMATGNETSLGSVEVTISSLFEGFAANDDLIARAA